jgi:hypothetical protein
MLEIKAGMFFITNDRSPFKGVRSLIADDRPFIADDESPFKGWKFILHR